MLFRSCYVSLDDESRALYIDKRLGISVIYDKNGKEILEAGKIKWIDIKSRNFGEGSHLMVFGINEDPYKPDSDNIAELICDYQEKPVEDEDPEEPIAPPEDPVVPPDESGDGDDNGEENEGDGDKEEPSEPELIIKGTLSIDGKKTIKAGSGRTYSVTAIEEESSNTTNGTVNVTNDPVSDPVSDPVKLSEDAEKILSAIRKNADITREELSQKFGKSLATVRRRIAELKEKGYIERVGSDKKGFWKVLK